MATSQMGRGLTLKSYESLFPSNPSMASSSVSLRGFPCTTLSVNAATSVASKFSTLNPLGDRVLIKLMQAEEKTQGGILLPSSAQKRPEGGEVVALGNAKTVGKTRIPLSVSRWSEEGTANTASINWLFEMVRRGTANTASINCAFIGVLIFITMVSRPIDAHRQFQYHGASEATKELSHANSTNVVLLVNITLLNNAVSEGAVCLDGSPPAYHLHRGFGLGANKWLVHMEGGGWCYDTLSCSQRENSPLGSSLFMGETIEFPGILSDVPSQNPSISSREFKAT